jgi:dTDP-4-dehydrorhamnose 3,5-epimerase
VIFREQAIGGVFAIEPEPAWDERGMFARTYSEEEFAEHGISFTVAQASISLNARRHTLRGMHLQLPPHEEAKLVRCVRGSVYDVVVDLRAGSPTQLEWLAVELAAAGRNALYVPAGLAHGFLTLQDDCELEYLISTPYVPSAAAGVRWDDPAIGVSWPSRPTVISPRDAGFPDLDAEQVRRSGLGGLAPAESLLP